MKQVWPNVKAIMLSARNMFPICEITFLCKNDALKDGYLELVSVTEDFIKQYKESQRSHINNFSCADVNACIITLSRLQMEYFRKCVHGCQWICYHLNLNLNHFPSPTFPGEGFL